MSRAVRPLINSAVRPLARAIQNYFGNVFSFQSLMAAYPTAEKWLWEAGNLTDEKVAWRRNQLLSTDRVNSSGWETNPANSATIALNQIVAPDGTTTATKVTEGTTTGEHSWRYMSLSNGINNGPVTWSIHIKAGERRHLYIIDGYLGFNCYFDAVTGVLRNGQGGTFTVTNAGNGWWRISANANASFPYTNFQLVICRTDTFSSGARDTYTGDGTSGFYVWGAQLERGSAPTAYQRITDFNTEFLAAFPQHTLFQDVNGQIPVTKMEDPIALVLDTKAGYQLGPELRAGGDFEGGLPPGSVDFGTAVGTYTLNENNPISGSKDGRLVITTPSAGARPAIGADVSGVVGRSYLVQFDYRVNSGTAIIYLLYNGSATVTVSRALTGSGRFQAVVTAAGPNAGLGGFYMGNSACDMQIDNWSVRELPGYHLVQSTAANRMKITSRVNQLQYTEQLDNAYWGKNAAITVTRVGDYATISVPNTIANGINIFFKQSVIPFASGPTATIQAEMRCATGQQISLASDGGVQTVTLTPEWQKVTLTSTIASGLHQFYVRTIANAQTYSFDIRFPQMELGSTASRYQRVVTATDYDYVGFPRLIEHDGLDDFGVTSRSVDLTGTDKVTVFAGVEKLSDAAGAILMEHSADFNTTDGFAIITPSVANGKDFSFAVHRIAGGYSSANAAGYSAPQPAVFTMAYDGSLSADEVRFIRKDGVAQTITRPNNDNMAGNFGSYPIYVGRRGGTSLPFRGRWSVLGGIGALINDGQMTNLERALAKTQGRTL